MHLDVGDECFEFDLGEEALEFPLLDSDRFAPVPAIFPEIGCSFRRSDHVLGAKKAGEGSGVEKASFESCEYSDDGDGACCRSKKVVFRGWKTLGRSALGSAVKRSGERINVGRRFGRKISGRGGRVGGGRVASCCLETDRGNRAIGDNGRCV